MRRPLPGRRSIRLAVVFAFIVPAFSWALESAQVPRVIYVGDRAQLVVQLPPDELGQLKVRLPVVAESGLPRSKDVKVLRAELALRGRVPVLVVDFIPLSVGDLSLPPLSVGGLSVDGLRARVSSLLETEVGGGDLSPPEGPLSAPGTVSMLYGLALALAAAVAAAGLFVKRGVPAIARAAARRRDGLPAAALRRVLAKQASKAEAGDARELFEALFPELRSYLGYRSGVPCLALTPAEFERAFAGGPAETGPRPAEENADGAGPEAAAPEKAKREKAGPRRERLVVLGSSDAAFLAALFRRGDEVRFGEARAEAPELRALAAALGALVDRIEAGAALC